MVHTEEQDVATETKTATFDLIVTAAGEVSGYTPEEALNLAPRVTQIVSTALENLFDVRSKFEVEAMVEPQSPPPTPEQRANVQAYTDRLGEESHQRYVSEVKAEQAIVHARDYAIAEKWAAKPGISERERCHGVVWDIRHQEDKVAQTKHDVRFAENELLEPMHRSLMWPAPVASAPGYAEHYQSQNIKEIEDGLLKSAASLFS